MSKEKCEEVRSTIVELITEINTGSLGAGKGVNKAIDHLEDAHMRLRYHMNQMGWLKAPVAGTNVPVTKPVVAPKTALRPATGIRTGLMNPQNATPASNEPPAQKSVTNSRAPRSRAAPSDMSLLD